MKDRIQELLALEFDSDLWEKTSKALNTGASLIGNPKIKRWVVGGTTALTLAKAAHEWYTARRAGETYSIRIYESDILYDRVNQWVSSSVDESKLRSVVASAAPSESYAESLSVPPEDESDIAAILGHPSRSAQEAKKKSALEVVYDGNRVQLINIDGYDVMVRVGNTASGAENNEKSRIRSTDYILIECPSLEAKRAVLNRLDREAQAITERRPRIYGAMQWGNFRQISAVPKRPISSVVLKEGQAER